MRTRLILVLALLIAACAPPGDITYLPDAAGIGSPSEVYIATMRGIDTETGRFGPDRSRTESFGRYVVQVPPQRQPGKIDWPRRGADPDPQRQFVTTEEEIYAGGEEFEARLARSLADLPASQRDVVVFAHGFNSTFAEGLYRIAQLDHDLNLPGVTVHYSWPSRGKPLAYVYDRDSVVYARDGYERLLRRLEHAGARRIVVVGHSLGAFLTMEAMRQIAISGDRGVLDRITGVILIAPDIDVDVFHSQAARIGRLPQPFYIFTSRRDRALALSARLTGQTDRLGNLQSPVEVADLDVTLIEVGEFSSGLGHFVPAESPLLLGILGRLADVDAAFNADRTGRPGLLTGLVLTFGDATQVILRPITAIAGAN